MHISLDSVQFLLNSPVSLSPEFVILLLHEVLSPLINFLDPFLILVLVLLLNAYAP